MKKLLVSWFDVEDMCYNIICNTKNINSDNFIISIGKGGLVPGVIIANKLGAKRLYNWGISSYDGNNQSSSMIPYQSINMDDMKEQQILIVDDILDTGNTFKYIHDVFTEHEITNITYVTLHKKLDITNQYTPPNHSYATTAQADQWIYYPWE